MIRDHLWMTSPQFSDFLTLPLSPKLSLVDHTKLPFFVTPSLPLWVDVVYGEYLMWFHFWTLDLWCNFYEIWVIFQKNIFPHFTSQCDVSIIFLCSNGVLFSPLTLECSRIISVLLTAIQNQWLLLLTLWFLRYWKSYSTKQYQ